MKQVDTNFFYWTFMLWVSVLVTKTGVLSITELSGNQLGKEPEVLRSLSIWFLALLFGEIWKKASLWEKKPVLINISFNASIPMSLWSLTLRPRRQPFSIGAWRLGRGYDTWQAFGSRRKLPPPHPHPPPMSFRLINFSIKFQKVNKFCSNMKPRPVLLMGKRDMWTQA